MEKFKLLLIIPILSFFLYVKSNRNAIIKASNPTASVKANPIKTYLNSLGSIPGFLEHASINEPNTWPTPVPAPPIPIVANPAPKILAAEIRSAELIAPIVYCFQQQKSTTIICSLLSPTYM